MQYEIVFKGDRCCSCYTCLPQSSPAAQTALKMVPGTPQMDQRLLTIATPKQVQHIHIHANKSKSYETVQQYIKTTNKTKLELFYALQRSRGHKERLKRS